MKKDPASEHWEHIHQQKSHKEVSWYEPVPETSLRLIRDLQLPAQAAILEVGGGNSALPLHLMQLGYENITVLDIAPTAIQKTREALGLNEGKVEWVVSNILDFQPGLTFQLWYDRAVFHFLTDNEAISAYVHLASSAISSNGYLVLGLFSTLGPTSCSGLKIKQYSAESLADCFAEHFQLIHAHTEDHPTPFGTFQNFLYCVFQKG